jgi:hypothetical protein
MKEIPFDETTSELVAGGIMSPSPDGSVWGNLQGCTEAGHAENGQLSVVPRPFPEAGLDFVRAVRDMLGQGTVATDTDIAIYSWMLLKFVTSCRERREEVYEQMTWLEYLGVDRGFYSPEFESLIKTLPRSLSAMRSDACSARTVGTVTIQVLFDMAGDGGLHMESVLRGPTQEMWIEPWRKLLGRPIDMDPARAQDIPSMGVVGVCPGVRLEGFEFDGLQVTGLRVSGTAGPLKRAGAVQVEAKEGAPHGQSTAVVQADYYLVAVPLEVIHGILNARTADGKGLLHQPMLDFDVSLSRLASFELKKAVAPMLGIQLYLIDDVPMCHGHVFYPESPWALTSVSQAQFWRMQLPGGLSSYVADPRARYPIGGIVSAIISDWETPARDRIFRGPDGKPTRIAGKAAKDCTEAEVKREVWLQLKEALNATRGVPLLDDDNLWRRSEPASAPGTMDWLDAVLEDAAELDRDVLQDGLANPFSADGQTPRSGVEPLFVHPKGSLHDRSDAQLRIPNLLLASDYVRTYTDVATMEAANEAARRAVLAILWREMPSPEGFPEIWPLDEGALFEAARALDRMLYKAGKLPHVMDAPQVLSGLFGGLVGNVAQMGIDLLGLRGKIKPPTPMAMPGGGFLIPQFSPTLTTAAVTSAARVLSTIHTVTKGSPR